MKIGRGETDVYNQQMIYDKMSVGTMNTELNDNNFPKTTNQDFHSAEVFDKAVTFGARMDK